jgi:hypothetical protein
MRIYVVHNRSDYELQWENLTRSIMYLNILSKLRTRETSTSHPCVYPRLRITMPKRVHQILILIYVYLLILHSHDHPA